MFSPITSVILITALLPSPSYPLGDLQVTSTSTSPAYQIVATPELYEVDKNLYTPEVGKFLFTDEQIVEANKVGVDLLVKDFINSPGLNGTRKEYNSFTSSRVGYSAELLESMKAPETPGTSYLPIIPLTTPDTLLPVFEEDGGPKMGVTQVDLETVSATEYQKTPQLVLEYNFTAPYRVSDEAALDYVRLLNDVKPQAIEKLVKPKVLTPGDDNVFLVNGTVTFTVTPKDGSWEVVSLATAYQYDVTDFVKGKTG